MTSPQNFQPTGSFSDPTAIRPIPQALKNMRPTSPKLDGMAQPTVVLPIKSKALNLPYNDQFKASTLIQELLAPNSTITKAMDSLLDWTGLEKQPLNVSSPIIPVCGSPIVATGLACALLHHHQPGLANQKIALLEWGQPESTITQLLDTNAPLNGLNELFQGQTDLTHLVLNAKIHRFMPQLYTLSQGEGTIKTMEALPKLSQLMAALSKKFHRIVLSLPGYEQDPRLPEILARLGMNYALFYDPDDSILRKLQTIRLVWRNGSIQRLT